MKYAAPLTCLLAVGCDAPHDAPQDTPAADSIRQSTHALSVHEVGRVTYRNTIRPILDQRCGKCHGPTIDDADPGEAWAVQPNGATPRVTRWTGTPSITSLGISSLCNPWTPMPPPQSEPALDPIDQARFDQWCSDFEDNESTLGETAANDLALGTHIPFIQFVDFTRTGMDIEFEYAGGDPEEAPNTIVSLFFDTDRSGFDGTLLDSTFPASPLFGQPSCPSDPGACGWYHQTHVWTLPTVPPSGRYWFYMCVYDGETVYCDYADTPFDVP